MLQVCFTILKTWILNNNNKVKNQLEGKKNRKELWHVQLSLTILLVFLGIGDLSVILQVESLDAAAHQVFPARLHGGAEQTGV